MPSGYRESAAAYRKELERRVKKDWQAIARMRKQIRELNNLQRARRWWDT